MSIFNRGIVTDEEDRLVARPYDYPRPLTASASRISIRNKKELDSVSEKRALNDRERPDLGWQRQAWAYYDLVGEIKHAANLVGSLISRIRIFGGYVVDPEGSPATLSTINDISEDLKSAVREAMEMLGSGPGGTSGLMRTAALNFFVTGEFYLVQERSPFGSFEPDKWTIRSIDEVIIPSVYSSEPIRIRPYENCPIDRWIELPHNSFVARIWRSHPRYQHQADSSLLGLLELLDELLLLSKASRATIKSRLNSGFLLLPDTLSVSADEEDEESIEEDVETNHEEFEEELETAMMTPIADEGSASAVVPLIIRGTREDIAAIRHISVYRTYDERHIQQVEKVLERILSSLDIPKEAVSGIGGAKYNTASVIEDSLVRNYLEPMTLMLVDALTTVYLRPVLRSMAFSEKDISRIVVWYDPSAITAKPSRADAADRGLEYGTVSKAAWRRAHGFTESDAPTELEIAQDMAVKRGALSEPVTEALLRTLIPSLLEQVQRGIQQQAGDVGNVLETLDGNAIPEPGAPAEVQPGEAPEAAPAPPDLLEPGTGTNEAAPSAAPSQLMEP